MVLETTSFDIVVASRGGDPSDIVQPHFLSSRSRQCVGTFTKEEALDLARAKHIRSYRLAVASFMALAQILRIVGFGMQSGKVLSDTISSGMEPFTDPSIKNRFIRLCGRESDVTEVSIDRYGNHIIPVFEDPSAVSYLVHTYVLLFLHFHFIFISIASSLTHISPPLFPFFVLVYM